MVSCWVKRPVVGSYQRAPYLTHPVVRSWTPLLNVYGFYAVPFPPSSVRVGTP